MPWTSSARSRLTDALLALALGATTQWRVSEQDVYWQVRAGDDFLRGTLFPTVDAWSSTAAGTPWRNFEWFSTLLLRLVWGLGEEPAMVVLRAVLATTLLWLLARTIRLVANRAHTSASHQEALVLTLVPLAFVALIPRIQVRPDTFVILLFAAVVHQWVNPNRTLRQQATFTAAAVVLATNLHPGTAGFIVMAALAWAVQQPWTLTHRLLYGALLVGLLFVNPYGINVVPFLLDHLLYREHVISHNPDHEPFTVAYLRSAPNGVGIAWLLLAASAAYGLLPMRSIFATPAPEAPKHSHPNANPSIPPPWRHRVVNGAVFVVLLALVMNRTRAVPYDVVYCLPLTVLGLVWLGKNKILRWSWPVGAAAWAIIAAVNLRHLIGWEADRAVFPIGCTRFIQDSRPQGNLFHLFGDGAYVVWYLRDYPDYVDTRETLFWPMQESLLHAMHTPPALNELLDKGGINTVLLPTMEARPTAQGLRSFFDVFFPRQTWALVYFDGLAQVRVRRTLQHAGIIEKHSYELLDPSYPPDTYVRRVDRTPAMDAHFALEVRRCLNEEPDNSFCHDACATTGLGADC